MTDDSPTENNHTKIDIPAPSPSDSDWKTIDVAVLYDKNKYDLNGCALNDVCRILE